MILITISNTILEYHSIYINISIILNTISNTIL